MKKKPSIHPCLCVRSGRTDGGQSASTAGHHHGKTRTKRPDVTDKKAPSPPIVKRPVAASGPSSWNVKLAPGGSTIVKPLGLTTWPTPDTPSVVPNAANQRPLPPLPKVSRLITKVCPETVNM